MAKPFQSRGFLRKGRVVLLWFSVSLVPLTAIRWYWMQDRNLGITLFIELLLICMLGNDVYEQNHPGTARPWVTAVLMLGMIGAVIGALAVAIWPP